MKKDKKFEFEKEEKKGFNTSKIMIVSELSRDFLSQLFLYCNESTIMPQTYINI